MGTQYFCSNKRRAQIIRTDPSITLNGIDYLEVLDSESPEEALRQRTLLVRLLRPVPALTPGNVQIIGGVRVTPVGVEWVGSAADAATLLADGLITAAEAAYFSAQLEPDHLLLVRTDSDGDYSNHLFRFVTSPTNEEPPPGFDPILSEVSFSFKVECPSDFDCEPDDDCPPEPESSPVIDYLAKDYNSFRQLILDRLSVTNPEWQERHVPDLNLALVELLAYAGDYLSYWQDGVATEVYLGTARRRTSVRRHARLLAYPMHDGSNARTWAQFEVDLGADGFTLTAPQSVSGPPIRLFTRMPSEPVTVDEADLTELLSKYAPTVFELRTSVTLRQAHNLIRFHTWGDEECCLPAGATRATLLDSDDPLQQLHLEVGDILIFEEVVSAETGNPADAYPDHRHAIRLTSVASRRDPLFNLPVVEIGWSDEDALPFPLCLSARKDDILLPDVSVARGNVALADHGRTVEREPLPAKTGHRKYRPNLKRADVTMAGPVSAATAASRILAHDPRQALPAVQLEGDGQTWSPHSDLLDSDRFAPHFVAETESDGRVYLRFGDGLYGVQPSDDAFTVDPSDPTDVDGGIYRIGNGTVGNIGADTLAHIAAPGSAISGVTRVRNPLPAAGGTDPESLEEVRQYAPQAFRRQERAVTEEDYGMVTERHPTVQRAVATRRWTGSWYTMFITVDRKGGAPVDALYETEIRQHVERYRLAGHDIEIDPPRFVSLDIRMSVCVKPGYFRSDVKEELLKVFSHRLLPDGRLGFFHPDNFTFGQTVYLSDVIAAAMSVTGVQWVDILPQAGKDHRFQRWGKLPNDEIDEGKIEMGRLEIARLDNDPSLPENGKIEFYMEGGL